ncbi:hypothetical protein HMPREF3167_07105 [Trueperella sp. HMSC08B05]|nr:hypothetical protein AKG36_06790 [Trueperella bernardiae]OFS73087.1 hypothetical protein HMPREF3167_07105 [Trueperella sp. HMSC08B05]
MPTKEVKKLIKRLEKAGLECRITKKNHILVYLDGKVIATLPSTPSDRRSLHNATRHIKAYGIDI